MELEELKQVGVDWFNKRVKLVEAGDAIEVTTPLIGSYGDNLYAWVEQIEDYYRISDDGQLMFKLDPLQENYDLLEEAEDIVVGSGFDFDEQHGVIFIEVEDLVNVPDAISDLLQLQIALSYLGN
ncbi:DUF1828 domain-containing protein [Lactobacillus sp. PV037]|uniref:DUF1828 domain-containing protein n=1 Tax=unclassified Lactobacillus TaxID=2620435 RepID=UPI00223EF142|nr:MULTISPECIES: DUF1828 domain-containing protein [unclassified Lactobacillus]QNQ82391.1 DUF1828 domain-containing protein [Lactobacillus sp. PV012]QNQ83495.1 DUF1828 domain-containing protein [Lactobacillus sp. PV037]